MKKWLLRIFFLAVAVMAIICCMGMDVNCDGEFQGISCSVDGCSGTHEHSYKVIEETESTCNEAGYVKYECTKCGYIDTQYKNKPDHTITTSLHRGDCRDGADHDWYEEESCANCDYVKRTTYYSGSALHIYDGGTVTYYSDGSGCGEITYTCLICGDTKTANYHSEESPQQQEYLLKLENEACGLYLKTCDLCNKSVTGRWHNSFDETVLVEPTQTEYGLAKRVCNQKSSPNALNCGVGGTEFYVLIPPLAN